MEKRNVPAEFLAIVEVDITRISEAITSTDRSEQTLIALHRVIDGKYQACIKDWGNSMYGYIEKHGFHYDYLGIESLLHNLELMKSKLTTYRYQVNAISGSAPNANHNVIIAPTLTNSVSAKIDINITFDDVRKSLDEMSSLTEQATKEAIEKVNIIEEIMQSGDSQKKKWEKIKPVLLWLTDKSVDIGIAILPLLLKTV